MTSILLQKRTKRDDIIRQAFHVFHRAGFHATCMDNILIGTGISKRTLYKYFANKEELILATLQHYREIIAEQIVLHLATTGPNLENKPEKKIDAIFELEAELLTATDFSGCFAMNAQLEYADKEPLIEAACAQFFDDISATFKNCAALSGCATPENYAQQLMLLFLGAIVKSQAIHDTKPLLLARDTAQILLTHSKTGEK